METILSTIKCVLKNVVPKNIKIGFIVEKIIKKKRGKKVRYNSRRETTRGEEFEKKYN